MISNRISVLGALAIASLLAVDSKAAELVSSFDHEPEVTSWATENFFGGFDLEKLSKNNATVIAVVGIPTSGVSTSELYLYQLLDERLKLVAYRPRINGIVEVKADKKNIYFFRDEVTVLSVAWHSLDQSRGK